MLIWDGSHIGVMSPISIVSRSLVGGRVHYMIDLASKRYIVRVLECSSSLPCVIDELKFIFNIQKNGTHRVTVNGKELVFIRQPMTPRGNMRHIYKINELSVTHLGCSIVDSIKRVIMFRELIGVSGTYESSMGIIGPYVHSLQESSMVQLDECTISDTLRRKYFKDQCVSGCIKVMLKVKSLDDIPEFIHMVRSRIEEVVERVDRSLIDIVDIIVNRILRHLILST